MRIHLDINNKRKKRLPIRSILFLLLFVSLSCFATKNTSMEEIAQTWVGAHNSGDVELMSSFREKYRKDSAVDNWQQNFKSLVERFGKFEVVGAMQKSQSQFDFLAESKSIGDIVRLQFIFFEDSPQQIKSIDLSPGDSEEEPLSPLPPIKIVGLNKKAQGVRLNEWLNTLAEGDLFSGSVLIANRNGVIFDKTYGFSSREYSIKNDLYTRFDVGSFNKDYTKLAIYQLMEQGKLSLDDKVGKYLLNYPNQDVKLKVTINQLINHTAGLDDYFTDEYFKTPMNNLVEIEDYIAIWGPKPLISEPGSQEQYSNYGYTVLGAIIEKISGKRYDQYVVDHIFSVAKMQDSGFFRTDSVEPNVATGYTFWKTSGEPGEILRKNIFHEPVKGGPWGKSYSTAKDLYRFFKAMFDGKFLKNKNNWLGNEWSKTRMELAGGGPGLNAFLSIKNGRMIIVMANLDPPIADRVAAQINSALTNK